MNAPWWPRPASCVSNEAAWLISDTGRPRKNPAAASSLTTWFLIRHLSIVKLEIWRGPCGGENDIRTQLKDNLYPKEDTWQRCCIFTYKYRAQHPLPIARGCDEATINLVQCHLSIITTTHHGLTSTRWWRHQHGCIFLYSYIAIVVGIILLFLAIIWWWKYWKLTQRMHFMLLS